MNNAARKRDPNRLLRMLVARTGTAAAEIPVEVLPLDDLPKHVVKRAVLSHPRRPKGVARANQTV